MSFRLTSGEARVVQNVNQGLQGDGPDSERQARPISALPPEKQAAAAVVENVTDRLQGESDNHGCQTVNRVADPPLTGERTPGRARQLIAGADVVANLKSVTTVTPGSERQARPLVEEQTCTHGPPPQNFRSLLKPSATGYLCPAPFDYERVLSNSLLPENSL